MNPLTVDAPVRRSGNMTLPSPNLIAALVGTAVFLLVCVVGSLLLA